MSNLVAKQSMSLTPQTIDEALRFADMMAKSSIVPKDYANNPGNILVAIQWGMELGLQPLQAMQNIAVINGRPAIWGDALIAIVRGSPLCEHIYETDDGHTATCRVKRRNEDEQVRTFSMDDAKHAGLIGKQGPWTQYPKRMRQMRARAFALRDVFPDVLKGIAVAEEQQDIKDMGTAERDIGQAVVVENYASAIPAYSDEDFTKNLPAWTKAIQAKKTTADELIAKVKTKGVLSEQQIADIRAIPTESTKVQAE